MNDTLREMLHALSYVVCRILGRDLERIDVCLYENYANLFTNHKIVKKMGRCVTAKLFGRSV